MHSKKGFTLIEMLIVIAIIAILVSIIVPTISSSTTKARAATDAANLRTVLSVLNIHVVNGNREVPEIIEEYGQPYSKMDPDAVLQVVFETPGFIDVFYVNNGVYYSLDYLSDIATYGESSLSTAKPAVEGVWYQIGNPNPLS